MFGLGWPEVLLILGVVVLIFGPKKIPEVGAALGKTLRGFKEEIDTPEAPEKFTDYSDPSDRDT